MYMISKNASISQNPIRQSSSQHRDVIAHIALYRLTHDMDSTLQERKRFVEMIHFSSAYLQRIVVQAVEMIHLNERMSFFKCALCFTECEELSETDTYGILQMFIETPLAVRECILTLIEPMRALLPEGVLPKIHMLHIAAHLLINRPIEEQRSFLHHVELFVTAQSTQEQKISCMQILHLIPSRVRNDLIASAYREGQFDRPLAMKLVLSSLWMQLLKTF